jgi:hypothetical protein
MLVPLRAVTMESAFYPFSRSQLRPRSLHSTPQGGQYHGAERPVLEPLAHTWNLSAATGVMEVVDAGTRWD